MDETNCKHNVTALIAMALEGILQLNGKSKVHPRIGHKGARTEMSG
jgi:hypothetical protein